MKSNREITNIWYVSKYAVSRRFNNPTRQYFLSKYFARYGKNIKLVSSRSSIISDFPSFGKQNFLSFRESKNFEEIILRGPKIDLGFSFKRAWSWLVFEYNFLMWSREQKRPDLIIVSSLSLLSFLSGALLKKKYKCKLVCEVRDIWPLTLMEMKGWGKHNPFIKVLACVEKIGYKYSDAIIGTMPNLKAHVKQVCPNGESKVYYIPTGFDSEFFDEDRSEPYDKYRDNSDCFTVGYAGTLGTANCIDQILEASKLLKGKNITFHIMGNGPLREALLYQKASENLTNVHFFDAVPKKEVQRFLSQCDLLINPWRGKNRLYEYGVSPNKWIDYMYSGRPILVALNGYRNIINEANCGMFIDADNPKLLASTILAFAEMDEDELRNMGQRGKTYLLNNLSYDVLADRYLHIVDNL